VRPVAALIVASLAGCAPPRVGVVNEADTQQCASASVEGVDVYSGTGAVDWSSAQASGRHFAFIKAAQGDYLTDTRFTTNLAGARAAGVIVSPYHFFDGTVDGVEQAQYFLDVLSGQGGLQAGDLPPMLDLECPTDAVESQADPSCTGPSSSGWVDSATLSQRAYDWLDTVEQATGRKPIIYTYPSWVSSVAFQGSALATYPLFIASYDTCADVPSPWNGAVFWQYSPCGTVPGIAGSGTDVDRFFGSDADLQQFLAASQPQPSVDLQSGGSDLATDMSGVHAHKAHGCDATPGGRTDAWTLLGCALLILILRQYSRRASSAR